MKTAVEQYIPLTEPQYYILLSLLKPIHGYGIMQEVENLTHGEVKLDAHCMGLLKAINRRTN